MTGTIWLFCGKIASGKTTAAQRLCAERTAVLLSADDLMLTMFDECLGARHRSVESRAVSFLLGIAADIAAQGIDAALDCGFWTADSRSRARAYCAAKKLPAQLVYCDIPDDLRLTRLRLRNEYLTAHPSDRREYVISDETRLRMDALFEEPAPGEADRVVCNLEPAFLAGSEIIRKGMFP